MRLDMSFCLTAGQGEHRHLELFFTEQKGFPRGQLGFQGQKIKEGICASHIHRHSSDRKPAQASCPVKLLRFTGMMGANPGKRQIILNHQRVLPISKTESMSDSPRQLEEPSLPAIGESEQGKN